MIYSKHPFLDPEKSAVAQIKYHSSNSAGMTLVEVIMALAVFAVLLTVTIGSLSSINRSKKAMDDYQDVYLVAQSMIRRMTRELQLATCDIDSNTRCSQGKGIIHPPDSGAQGNRPTLQATSSSLNTPSSITFLAMDAGQFMGEKQSHVGMVQIAYRLAREKQDDKLFTLVREEIPYILPAEDAYKQSLIFPVAKNVVDMSFEFYDLASGQWSDQWGTEKSIKTSLPSLIRLTMTLRSADGFDVPFQTMVAVRMASQQN